MNRNNVSDRIVSIKDAVDKLYIKGQMDNYIVTGIDSLDRILGDMKKGSLILLGARPQTGMTQFSLNIAYNTAKVTGKKTLFIPYEHSKEQIAARTIWMLSGISDTLSDVPLLIYDDHDSYIGRPFERIIEDAEEIENLGMIVVDFIQLMPDYCLPLQESFEKIICLLKETAEKLNVTVILNYLLPSINDYGIVGGRDDTISDMVSGCGFDKADAEIILSKVSEYQDKYDDKIPLKCRIRVHKREPYRLMIGCKDGRFYEM